MLPGGVRCGRRAMISAARLPGHVGRVKEADEKTTEPASLLRLTQTGTQIPVNQHV